MVITDMSNSKADIKTIGELVDSFFESADVNKDGAISQEEFVSGVQDMPVILHLLQCDPDDTADNIETANHFDSLHVSDETAAASKQTKTNPNVDCRTSDRSSSYKAK